MNELSLIKQNYYHYINQIIKNHKISHTYLFEIDDYDTDFHFIVDFIKMILCDCSYEELSSNNSIVSLIDHDNYPDIIIIEPDGAYIKKGQLVDLKREYSNKSLLNGKRFYIIKNAEKLNSSSANTMLKFLEEPEDDIIAILVTDSRYHVLETILSRCQIISLKEDLFDLFDDDLALELLGTIVYPRSFFLKYNHFVNDLIVDKKIMKEKMVFIEKCFIIYLDNKYNVKKVGKNEYFNLLDQIDPNLLLIYLSIIEEELPKLDFNVNYKLWLDALFSRLVMGG